MNIGEIDVHTRVSSAAATSRFTRSDTPWLPGAGAGTPENGSYFDVYIPVIPAFYKYHRHLALQPVQVHPLL
jgi:hypothetical protein